MTVLILHGVEGYAGIHWQKWLHDELVNDDYTVLMPTLPNSNHPSRKQWLDSIKDILKNVDLSTLIIIGHSLGVTAALDFIEQSPFQIKALISIAGFSDNYGSKYNDFYMKEKNIDFEKVGEHVQEKYVIISDNDPYVPQESLKLLSRNLNVSPIIVANGGHFNSETQYKNTFPLLYDLFKKIK